MKLSRLELKNVKLVRELSLDFTRDGRPRPWTVLIGENGTCKTSILQAIGLAASGTTRANQLADASRLHDRRVEKSILHIDSTFDISDRNAVSNLSRLRSQLFSESGHHQFYSLPGSGDGWQSFVTTLANKLLHPTLQRIEQSVPDVIEMADRSAASSRILELLTKRIEDELNKHPLQDVREFVDSQATLNSWRAKNAQGLLVLGYGISRFLPEPLQSPQPDDLARERLEPLFGKRPLLGTDFVEHLARRNSSWASEFDAELSRALLELVPHIPDIDLTRASDDTATAMLHEHRFTFQSGTQKLKLPATWLSQGYQATIAWIADLIGHAFWDAKAPVACEDIHALVLIDELDLHLHPRWQSGFVTALKRMFRNVQFIATTHSPMVLPGLAADEVVRLVFDDEGSVVAQHPGVTPATLTGCSRSPSLTPTSRSPLTLSDANRAHRPHQG